MVSELAANKLSLNINTTKLLVINNIKGNIPQLYLRLKGNVIISSNV